MDGKGLVRLAQLRGEIALLARGGRFDLASRLLGQLARADLALGLPVDSLLRARQAAELAETRGEPLAAPLAVLAATLLAAGVHDEALDAAALAIDRAGDTPAAERARIEAMARLVGGSAQRRAGRLAEARLLLDAARGGAARIGEAVISGLALAELGQIDVAEHRPAAGATCFEFAGEFLRRAGRPDLAVEADTLAVSSWAETGDVETATGRAARASDRARKLGRLDLVAYIDGVLADLALQHAPDAAVEACALAAESAQLLRVTDTALARELSAQARLRQVRAASDPTERTRHLEAGIDLALSLDRPRSAARLGSALSALVDDAARRNTLPERGEVDRLAQAIAGVGDAELGELARAVLAAGDRVG